MSWFGGGHSQCLARPRGGVPALVWRPKRIRRAFSGQFSLSFCPNQDQFGQNAVENWPALGSPVDRPALHRPRPFLALGMLWAPGNRTEKTWPTLMSRHSAAFREQSPRMDGGQVCASVVQEDTALKDGDDFILGTQGYLTPRVFQSAGSCRWHLRCWEMRGCGLRFPDMETTRDRTPEAQSWGSESALEPGHRDGTDPWYSTRDGTPAGRGSTGVGLDPVRLAECLLVACVSGHSQCPTRPRGGGPAELRPPWCLLRTFSGQFS